MWLWGLCWNSFQTTSRYQSHFPHHLHYGKSFVSKPWPSSWTMFLRIVASFWYGLCEHPVMFGIWRSEPLDLFFSRGMFCPRPFCQTSGLCLKKWILLRMSFEEPQCCARFSFAPQPCYTISLMRFAMTMSWLCKPFSKKCSFLREVGLLIGTYLLAESTAQMAHKTCSGVLGVFSPIALLDRSVVAENLQGDECRRVANRPSL